jgi:CheY-like chemotaxis protein
MDRYVAMLWTDPDDRYITEWALAETGSEVNIRFVTDIGELEDRCDEGGEPALILLNDRGAIHGGQEQLNRLKSHTRFSHIPVIILGEVSTADYIAECYRAGANSYITKPSSIAGTKEKVALFFRYWFDVAEV